MKKQTASEGRLFDSRSHGYPGHYWESASDAGHDSWVLSLSDLMTLMLIFFLIWTTLKMTSLKTPPDIRNPVETTGLKPIKNIESILMEMAPVKKRRGNLIIVLQEELTFPEGQAELTGQGLSIIARIASILKHETGYELDILGHTDSTPVSLDSRWKNNTELSLARASAVFNALAQAGISPARMKAQGLGALFPIRHEAGDIIYAASRRVELVLKPAEKR